MSPFYLAQPLWGLLALLPLLLLGWHHWGVSWLAQTYCSPALIPFMRLTQDSWRSLPWRWLAVWMLLVVVLCQPKWVNEDAQAQQRPIQWVALVDLSDSMQAQDVQPNRLQQARWLLEQSANQWQQGDKVGLIAFSASPHWLMPITADKALWQAQLSLLEASLLPLRGSLLQDTMAEVDKQLPANVGVFVVTDGGGIDVTQSAHRLSRPALMVVLGRGAAALPPSVADGAGVDVGVPVSKVKRLAHDWGIEWVRGEQASLDIASWLAQQRDDAAVVSGAHSTQQDRDLSAFVLLLALVVWFNFWCLARFERGFYALLALSLLVVWYQANAEDKKQDQQEAAQASRAFQKAFRDADNEVDQLRALQGLAASLQAQSDWLSAAQTWRGVLAYQPENNEAKAQLKLALSHLPKSVDWSGEGGKRPKGSREGFIDDWPDMPEQEETKDVLQETSVKNRLEIPQIPPSPPLTKGGSTEPIVSSQLALQQKQARTDTAFLGEARALGAQQRQFYQRLFEQEAGFAAAQTEPQTKDGVAPW